MVIFKNPSTFFSNARKPNAVFSKPVVLFKNDEIPIEVLLTPIFPEIILFLLKKDSSVLEKNELTYL